MYARGGGGGGFIVILVIDSGGGFVNDGFEWKGIVSARHGIIIKCWFLKLVLFISELFTTSAFKMFFFLKLWKINKFVIVDIDSLDGKKKEKYYEVVMVKKDARLSGKCD